MASLLFAVALLLIVWILLRRKPAGTIPARWRRSEQRRHRSLRYHLARGLHPAFRFNLLGMLLATAGAAWVVMAFRQGAHLVIEGLVACFIVTPLLWMLYCALNDHWSQGECDKNPFRARVLRVEVQPHEEAAEQAQHETK